MTDLPVRKYDALCCPDFPPPAYAGSDKATCTVNVRHFVEIHSLMDVHSGQFVFVMIGELGNFLDHFLDLRLGG